MSSSCGLTEIVLEVEAANDVYALLSRAKEECASEVFYNLRLYRTDLLRKR